MKFTKGKDAAKNDKKDVSKPVANSLGKRKAALKPERSIKKQNVKSKPEKKDPNKPKRPPSAFFVFLEDFRKIFKEEHPNVKAVSAVGKAAGEKWKSMSKAEKAPFEAKAVKRKSDYERQMIAYNKKQEKGDQEDADEESDNSPAGRDDESEEDEEEEEDDDDDE
ncbi:high mobility group B protein 1-like isoform X2 [Mercurialis annua]|uniref:high mobility group B protein 1-like isoform X2 n=1 Tax=Mercurialis annua TaxID=3986 RepID=UPI002160B174|nr:high mobility group B protein 1-like isoform X2 [Mercurialis annua]XP_050211123.1 high mobility group B protein 1-like isoform X2 [Mercurialis annua]